MILMMRYGRATEFMPGNYDLAIDHTFGDSKILEVSNHFQTILANNGCQLDTREQWMSVRYSRTMDGS